MLNKESYFSYRPDFEIEKSKMKDFLLNYVDKNLKEEDRIHGKCKYIIELQKIANKKSKLLTIHCEDIDDFFSKDNTIYKSIISNTKRYLKIFYDIAEEIMPTRTSQINSEEIEQINEVIMNQRMANLGTNLSENNDRNLNKFNDIPSELLRRYEIIIVPGLYHKVPFTPMRHLKASEIGSLISVNAIVVRTTDVKPFLKVACYACDICGFEAYQFISSRVFIPMVDCPSLKCKNNQSRGKLYSQSRSSKFVSYQEIRIQELSDQVPIGHVPRSMTIIALGECVRQCTPGDMISVHGIYLPSAIGQGRNAKTKLLHDLYIEAFSIIKHKLSYKDTYISEEELNLIESQKLKTPDIFTTLSRSIAPEIFGLDDIKKALLLLMVGGVNKEMSDGMKIRGAINILLLGDPGVAKSQLLKYIANLSPRGVYTTGKGSSGVGLTAAIVKDPITNELTLEGGALVLADMGVCCIDEFDKMTDFDRANIHEVMEQQTVSIAKAGITARLNARASVLAAANPIHGRYNRKLSPNQNINLPAALISRFDLIFLLVDKPERNNDELLAKHVTLVHQNSEFYKNDTEILNPKFIRAYIAEARKINPSFPKNLHNFIVQKYVDVRKEIVDSTKDGYQYITPRTLLAIIRLSQGLARLRFNEEVEQIDVDMALKLIDSSRNSVNEDDQEKVNKNIQKNDTTSSIFLLIRDLCLKNISKTSKYGEIERIVLQKGFKINDLKECLSQYSDLNVLYINDHRTEITLL